MEEQSSSFLDGFFGGIFYGLSLSDFAIPIGVLLWLIVNSMKLSQIDFSDWMTGLTYCAFSAFVGMILAVVVPQDFHTLKSVQSMFPLFLSFVLLSAFRWLNLLIGYKNSLLIKKKERVDGQT